MSPLEQRRALSLRFQEQADKANRVLFENRCRQRKEEEDEIENRTKKKFFERANFASQNGAYSLVVLDHIVDKETWVKWKKRPYRSFEDRYGLLKKIVDFIDSLDLAVEVVPIINKNKLNDSGRYILQIVAYWGEKK